MFPKNLWLFTLITWLMSTQRILTRTMCLWIWEGHIGSPMTYSAVASLFNRLKRKQELMHVLIYFVTLTTDLIRDGWEMKASRSCQHSNHRWYLCSSHWRWFEGRVPKYLQKKKTRCNVVKQQRNGWYRLKRHWYSDSIPIVEVITTEILESLKEGKSISAMIVLLCWES